MAKNSITSDMLEMILMKVTDKFTEALSTMMSQFSTIISATVNSKLLAIDARLDSIETKLAKATDAGAVTVATVNKAAALDCQSAVEIASRAMLEFEREKEDARARSCNVIITGLPPNPEINDGLLVESFCENNLTVKPRIVSSRRLGKDRSSPTSKLCITLENSDAAEDLIDSATLLRSSTDATVRRVFFNKDLTRSQADAAYKLRCLRRSRPGSTSGPPVLHPGSVSSTYELTLSPTAAPFLPAQ